MVLGAKARAILEGRFSVTAKDIRALAYPVLRHRIFTNFNADAEGVSADDIIQRLVETVPQASEEGTDRGRLPEVFRSADAG